MIKRILDNSNKSIEERERQAKLDALEAEFWSLPMPQVLHALLEAEKVKRESQR